MMNTEGVRATIDITSSEAGLENTIAMIKKLKDEINSLDPSTVKLATSIAKLNQQNQKTQTEVAKTATQWAKEEAQIIKNSAAKEQNALKTEKLRIQVEKLQKAAKGSSSFSLNSLSLAAFGTNLRNIINVGRKFGQFTQELIQQSADYIETQNLFEVSMKETKDEATDFVNEMARAFNLNDRTLKSAVGTFNLLGTQMGLTNEQALTFSETLTKLAVDTSSLRNTDVETALTKLRAGISGEVKPLRQWGIDITEATLKQEALANGITKSYAQMSYAEKSLLRYSAILRQTTADQGDYARTLESPAQLMKQIREQIQALGIAIGNVLLPMLYKVLTPLLSIIMVLKEIFVWLGTFFDMSNITRDTSANSALSFAEDTSNALGGAVKNAKELKKWLGGYDELNNVTPSSKASGASGGGTGGIGIDPEFLKLLRTYDNQMGEVANKAAEIRDKILEWLGFTIDENGQIVKLKDGLTKFEIIVGAIVGLLTLSAVKKVMSFISWLAGGSIVKEGKSLFTVIKNIGSKVKDIFTFIKTNIGTIAKIGLIVGAILVTAKSIYTWVKGNIEQSKKLNELNKKGLEYSKEDAKTFSNLNDMNEMLNYKRQYGNELLKKANSWGAALTLTQSELEEGVKSSVEQQDEYLKAQIRAYRQGQLNKEEEEQLKEILYGQIDYLVNIGDELDRSGKSSEYIHEYTAKYRDILKEMGKSQGPLEEMNDFFDKIYGRTKNINENIGGTAKGVADIIATKFPDKTMKIKVETDTTNANKGLGSIAQSFANSLSKSISNVNLTGLVDKFSTLFNNLNKNFGFKINTDNLKKKLGLYESGGLPPIGSLFVAGEGKTTEFVGDIGGRTNVVNEKQLEAALYNALVRANSSNENREEYINEIYIGGNKTDTILNRRRTRRQNITGKVSA